MAPTATATTAAVCSFVQAAAASYSFSSETAASAAVKAPVAAPVPARKCAEPSVASPEALHVP
ncbi:MAG: hypothetical protein ACK559_33705, partial [bacterium]